MSVERRKELLDWAAAADAWIVEDEYDAEYRYAGRSLAALQSLDRSGSVVYLGTFTKMLFNSPRLGFVVLPERLVDAFAAVRSLIDRHPPTLEQAALTEFMQEGHFRHHVLRMRQVYARRMAALATTDADDSHRRTHGSRRNRRFAAAHRSDVRRRRRRLPQRPCHVPQTRRAAARCG